MKKACIVCSAKLPQPPILGGAVPQLIQHIVDENEKNQKIELTCLSIYNDLAEKEAKKYKNTTFVYLKLNRISIFIDRFITKLLNVLKMYGKVHSYGFLFRMYSFKVNIKKYLLKNNFDYVIFENSVITFRVTRSKKIYKKYKNKYFYHIHVVPRKYKWFGKLLSKSLSVICVSNFIANKVHEAFPNYNIKTTVLKNCVDTNLFKKLDRKLIDSFKSSYKIDNDDFLIGFVGRITIDKGLIELIKALKLINNHNIKLLIAGSSFYNSTTTDSYIDLINAEIKNIKDNVIFTGYIDNNNMPIFYNACDVICLPSTCEDAAPLTVVESVLCQKTTISTISGGTPEYLKPSCGILLDKSNTEYLISDIAKNIDMLYNNRHLLEEYEKNTLSEKERFSTTTYFSNFLNLLEDM